jgi:hypothetical protein
VWPAHLQAEDDINTWSYGFYRGRSASEVVDETLQIFQVLLTVIGGLPDDARIEQVHRGERVFHLLWLGDQRFPAGEFFDHF